MCVDLGTALMIGGTVLSGVGQVSSAQANAKAAKYNAEVQRQNAILADKRAKNVLEAGQREEQKQMAITQKLIAKQKVSFAASGVDPGYGSALDTMTDTAMLGEVDRLTIRTSTYRSYDDTRNEATAYRNQASLYDAQASNSRTAGMLNAFGSVLGGLSGAASYNKQYGNGKFASALGMA